MNRSHNPFLPIRGGLASNYQGSHVLLAVAKAKTALDEVLSEVARLLVQLEVEDYNLEEPTVPMSAWLCRGRSIGHVLPDASHPRYKEVKSAMDLVPKEFWETPLVTMAITTELHQGFLLAHDAELEHVEAVRLRFNAAITFRNTSTFQVD